MSESPPLGNLMKALGCEFRNQSLLELALTHSSYRNEHLDVEADNERLEFLGDAVLGAVVSHLLVEHYPSQPEGVLTRYKAVLVSEQGLFQTAQELSLGDFLRLGRGEDQTGGRAKPSVLSDTVEAIVAAVFLDSGFSAAQALIARLYKKRLLQVGGAEQNVDFKTKLQELIQVSYNTLPVYSIVDFSGPDHARLYSANVSVNDEVVAEGSGHSKKEAEQNAAMVAFEKFQENPSS